MMRGRANAAEITKLIADLGLATTRVAGLVGKARRKVSFDVERGVKIAMPVDTGRARAAWGHWTPGDIAKPTDDANPADGHWEDTDTYTEQGANLYYVEILNSGT